jgi:DHA1 family bicyclomycin/chloramphenicol resistance-like MFS transporter
MREFVALMAALMASNALAIDAMLPALPAMGEALNVADENRRQLVITFYLLGFGLAQLVYGPISDRVGRRPVLVVTMAFYAAFALLCGIVSSFEWLLVARALQGVAAAGTRVLVVSVVRDRFEGGAMARVMSLVFIIFMIIPVLAPSFGQAVLAFASWRYIFIGLAVYGAVVLAWSLLRLPETLAVENRRPLSFASVWEATVLTLTNRVSIGNTVASTLIFGGLFASSIRCSRSCRMCSGAPSCSASPSRALPGRWRSAHGTIRGWWSGSARGGSPPMRSRRLPGSGCCTFCSPFQSVSR